MCLCYTLTIEGIVPSKVSVFFLPLVSLIIYTFLYILLKSSSFVLYSFHNSFFYIYHEIIVSSCKPFHNFTLQCKPRCAVGLKSKLILPAAVAHVTNYALPNSGFPTENL